MFESLKLLRDAFGIEAIVFCVLAYQALDGYRRGFIRVGLLAAGLLCAAAFALLTYRLPAILLSTAFNMPFIIAEAGAFFTLWWLGLFGWEWVTRHALRRVKRMTHAARWNHLLGPIPGVAAALVLVAVLVTVMMAFPMPSGLRARIANSPLTGPILGTVAKLDVLARGIVDPSSTNGLNLLTAPTIRPLQEPTRLHFIVTNGTADLNGEREMFELINRERRVEGVPELLWSNDLANVARLHSGDMLMRGYFGHIDPEGNDPADRVSQANVPYGSIGENLAFAPNAFAAHEGLMASPEHRANILDAGYKYVGIGVIDGGIYGNMYTQEFSD